MDRYDIEAVKEVLPKPPAGDHFTQVLDGCGYQPKILTAEADDTVDVISCRPQIDEF